MSNEWMQVLQKQGETAQHLQAQAQHILGRRELTLDQALLLGRIIQKGAQNIEDISRQMRDDGMAQPYLEAADALRQIYRILSDEVEAKLQTLRRREIVLVSDT
jgi:hypothetical protein